MSPDEDAQARHEAAYRRYRLEDARWQGYALTFLAFWIILGIVGGLR